MFLRVREVGFQKNIHKNFSLQRGSVLVELAIVVPVLIGLTFAALDYGQIVYSNQEMSRILNEGLRYASKESGITAGVNGGLGCIPRKYSVCSTSPSSCPDTYNTLFARILNLRSAALKKIVTISEIEIDYDVSAAETTSETTCKSYAASEARPNCFRTIAGTITYSFTGMSIFFRGSNYKVTSRVSFLGVGREGTSLCS